MTRTDRVIDEIDRLVDEQLAESSGRFASVTDSADQMCTKMCGDLRHTLPITERMREMRALHQRTVGYYEGEARVSQQVVDELNAYRYDEDDSRIVCPGSGFIGPMPAPRRPAQPWVVIRYDPPPVSSGVINVNVTANSWARIQSMVDTLRDACGTIVDSAHEVSRVLAQFQSAYLNEPTEAEEELSPQQRALPRPSTSPPMWAIDATRQRRNRRRA